MSVIGIFTTNPAITTADGRCYKPHISERLDYSRSALSIPVHKSYPTSQYHVPK